jgi:hypothetical protein
MAIQSLNDIIDASANGRVCRFDFNKIFGGSAATAGRSYDFSGLGGNPAANTWSGTALNFQEVDESSNFTMFHGGNVSTAQKLLMNMGAICTAATGIPGTLLLLDIEGYWPGISNNTTAAQNLVGTPSLRATDGKGLRLYWVQTAVAGATAQNIAVSYTNQAGTSGRSLAATTAMTASAIVNHISHSGTAANNYTPFLPLGGGDSGVRNVASVTFSAANTGTGALVLARPLMEIPLGILSVYHNKDMLGQFPPPPVIPDGAGLSWVFIAGGAVAANTTFAGHITTVWG